MEWNNLLNSQRRKDVHGNSAQKKGTNTSNGRYELERDYDRILFSTPIRRLADKTQVFPLDVNDSVRTRLTHSHEVSNLARGIGIRLTFELKESIFGSSSNSTDLQRSIPALLAAIGLVHDLGNPPFGHQGERAIQHWFEVNRKKVFGDSPEEYINDFLNFDGNSQTFRLVTKLQILNDNFGLNLTYATLASMLKYPVSSTSTQQQWEKHGFFKSEEDIVKDVWEKTGLKEGVRHPLTYIMEACDDIAYSVLDAEDTVKKGLASFYDLVDFLEFWVTEYKSDEKQKNLDIISNLITKLKNKNSEFKKENLSPAELNDMSMQMFRVYAIAELVSSVVDAFKDNVESFMSINCTTKSLIKQSRGGELCKALKKFDFRWGYRHKSVLKLELEGFNYIHGLMDMLWIGIHGKLKDEHDSTTPFGKYAYQKISENYRRVFEDKKNTMPTIYKEAQLLTDAISGMTDSYLIILHNELESLYKKWQ
ncbi:deoxyguanosinetriphosphate triphosphohydrolase family protein [Shewanella algae]|uniref:deoxyguanosinetriphosphate triphosphohydrolase family protein n=1 Tax=Shewanella algae TaxID=38313 RepID=UPI001AADA906|nr:dNTP triphosphohydrolase [Shewanella algae]MBO2583967.1 dNTP triphosphohydrolase [Shewanella algae]MBO2659866.1 dNTP triphosphohydrolase [Shewanella algae]